MKNENIINGIDTAAHQGLVVRFIRRNRWLGAQHSFDRDDLLSEGWLAIREAAEKFDHSRGLKFSTFAWPHIKRRLVRYFEDNSRTVRVPSWAQQASRLERKEAGEAELAQADPYPTSSVEYADDVHADDATSDPVEYIQSAGLRDAVQEALCDLEGAADAVVIKRHYMDGKTFKAVAAPIGRSGEWARLKAKDALDVLAQNEILAEYAEA